MYRLCSIDQSHLTLTKYDKEENNEEKYARQVINIKIINTKQHCLQACHK